MFTLGKEHIHKEIVSKRRYFVNAFRGLPCSNFCLSMPRIFIGWKGPQGPIWSNISLQKHGLDKTAQHPLQLNLESIHWLGNYHCSKEIIPMANCSH